MRAFMAIARSILAYGTVGNSTGLTGLATDEACRDKGSGTEAHERVKGKSAS